MDHSGGGLMAELTPEILEQILDKKLKPIHDEISGMKKTMFGEDMRGGIVVDVAKG